MNETIQNIRQKLSPYFSNREIDAFIRIIFEHLMNYSQVDIIMHKDSELSAYMKDKIAQVVNRLINHEPIQYIFNEAYFYGYYFKVTRDTLIPRPETEELVDMIVQDNKNADLKILDIGTGSGCIAISLAKAMNFPIVSALDISVAALKVAKENATRLKAHINFINQDILDNQYNPNKIYDIIVSNPPYICNKEKVTIEKNVLDYEPHSALFVEDTEPTIFYDRISNFATKHLASGGKLYFEINNVYADDIATNLKRSGFIDVTTILDMHGNKRFIKALKPKSV